MNSKKLEELVNSKASSNTSMRLHNFISKKNIAWFIVGLILLTGIIISLIWNIRSRSEASLAGLINYQAKLTDASNIPVADGDYNLRFRLCTDNASPCSTPIWAETSCFSPDSGTTCNGTGSDQRVAVTNGFINVLLGQISSLLAVDFNQTLYLEVSVGGSGDTPQWETLAPTKKLSVVPSAFESMSLGGKTESEFATLAEEEIITSPWRFNVTSSAPGISINQLGTGYGFFVNGTSLFGSLGTEKVTDGAFPSASNWTLGATWSFDATNLEIDHTSGTGLLEQDVSAVAGEVYYVSFEIKNATTGTVTVAVGGASGTAISANGISQATLTATTTGNLTFTPTSGFDGSIDNVSVKKLNSTGNMYVMGNVGIGTISPAALLELSAVSPELRLTESAGSSYTRLTKVNTNNVATRKNIITALPDSAGIDSYTVLDLHANGLNTSTTFTNSSTYAHTVTAQGNAQISVAQSKFGGASATFDGSGDYLESSNSTDFNLNGTDFTIDFWYYYPGSFTQTVPVFVSNLNAAQTEGFIIFYYSGNFKFQTGGGGNVGVAWTPSTGWYHMAVSYTGGKAYFFINGNLQNAGGTTMAAPTASTQSLWVGWSTGSGSYYLNGYMDELRISKGIARWTNNFTLPTGEYNSGGSAPAEITVWESKDSAVAGEKGIQTFGDPNGRTVLDGKTVRFDINSVDKMTLDANGNLGIGTTTYPLKLDVAGSARFTGTATSVLTGTIDPAASTTVTGVGTQFTTELVVGDRITVTGETRTVTAIASATSLTVDTAFTDNANDTSPDKLSAIFVARNSAGVEKMIINDLGSIGIGTTSPLLKLDVAGSARFTGSATSVLTGTIDLTASTTVTGVGTQFLTELVIGDRITVGASPETRTITAIASDTSLTVDTAFTDQANDTSPDKLAAIFVARASNGTLKMVVDDAGTVYIPSMSTAGVVKNDTSGKLIGGNVLTANDMTTALPKRGTMWGDEATGLSGTPVSSSSTNAWYNQYSYINGLGNNGSAGWNFTCAAGTYTFSVLYVKSSAGGKADLYIDGGVIATTDSYKADPTTWNNVATITDIALTAGIHTFKFIVNGHTAPSTGYGFLYQKFWYKQASD